ncbi:hypothetical protein TM48_01424 [Mycobacterium shottsii]|nr:hypothetical protein TM48_01424 [Mycobacterium shottsii]
MRQPGITLVQLLDKHGLCATSYHPPTHLGVSPCPGLAVRQPLCGAFTALGRSRGHARCGARNRTPICARCSVGEPANRHGFTRYRLAHIAGSGPHSRPIPGELAGSPKAGVAGLIFDTPWMRGYAWPRGGISPLLPVVCRFVRVDLKSSTVGCRARARPETDVTRLSAGRLAFWSAMLSPIRGRPRQQTNHPLHPRLARGTCGWVRVGERLPRMQSCRHG